MKQTGSGCFISSVVIDKHSGAQLLRAPLGFTNKKHIKVQLWPRDLWTIKSVCEDFLRSFSPGKVTADLNSSPKSLGPLATTAVKMTVLVVQKTIEHFFCPSTLASSLPSNVLQQQGTFTLRINTGAIIPQQCALATF